MILVCCFFFMMSLVACAALEFPCCCRPELCGSQLLTSFPQTNIRCDEGTSSQTRMGSCYNSESFSTARASTSKRSLTSCMRSSKKTTPATMPLSGLLASLTWRRWSRSADCAKPSSGSRKLKPKPSSYSARVWMRSTLTGRRTLFVVLSKLCVTRMTSATRFFSHRWLTLVTYWSRAWPGKWRSDT